MRKLQCTNPECREEEEDAVFTVNMTVDENGDACSSARELDGNCFTCCFCESEAEWVEENN